jgi:cell filamentation protein
LKPALSEAVNDRDAFMKGIDASYAYEGYASYSALELGC